MYSKIAAAARAGVANRSLYSSAFFGVAKKRSVTPLSRQSPRQLMLRTVP